MKVASQLVNHAQTNAFPALISVKRILVWNNVKERVENVLRSVVGAQKNAGPALPMLRKL